jgi:colanic acid/amylovoran biosynthesis glycosyltransferase
MRIAVILNSFPEISEKFLLNAIIGLKEAGADVTVFAAHRAKTGLRHPGYEEYGIDSITRYLDIPRPLRERFLRAPAVFLSLLLKNPKAAIEAIRVKRYRTVAKNMKLLWFGRAFAGERFDVAHCHFGANGLIGAYLKECGFCKSYVTTFHGSDINTYPSRHGLNVYRELYNTCDLVTANTPFTKSRIVANGCATEKIRVIPVGLMTSEYSSVDRSKIRPHTVLTVGRLEEKKGHRYALEAIALLKERYPDVHYCLAGGGSLRDGLVALASSLNIADSCEFLGVCDASRVAELYATCAVFLLPSVTASNGDMEGQGLVLQEAQACGMPVVSTLHNGIPDGVLDGVTGFLVPERDPEAIALRIGKLFEDSRLARSMGEEGKKFVPPKYDISVVTNRFMECYREISK